MSLVLFYNPGNQHIMEADERDTEKLGNSGFRRVERYELVAVFNPGLNQHKTVLKADLQTWLNQGYYAEPTVVYHPEKGSMTVSAENAQELYKQGWYDTPAKFPTSTLVGVSGAPLVMPAKTEKNEEPEPTKPLAKMTKAEIAQAYFDAFGQTLDAELTKEQMIAAFESAKAAA
jgi:hypothetical protein